MDNDQRKLEKESVHFICPFCDGYLIYESCEMASEMYSDYEGDEEAVEAALKYVLEKLI